MDNKRPALATIREHLLAGTLTAQQVTALAADPRVGAQKLYQRYQRHQQKIGRVHSAYEQRLHFEHQLWPKYSAIAGIDEVGRGPLAGPVVTAAVVLPHDAALWEVNDSKQLSAKKRLALFSQIMNVAVDVALGIATPAEIDTDNIYHATEIAMGRAVHALWQQPNFLLVDAMTVPVALPQQKLIKGDARSISIGAASIVAKVARDRLMETYDRVYPGYGFAHNAGYGTAEHLAGLQRLGATPIHRRSFSPVQLVLKNHH